ncbi:MAG TPA: acyl-CoA dehydrogenase, partial [Rhodanobacteraceae bacterium]
QALDFLRALGKLGLAPLLEAIDACLADAGNTDSTSDIENIRTTVRHADAWLHDHAHDHDALQAGALRLGVTCARSVAAALLARHAAWAQRAQSDHSSIANLRRFCAHGLDRIICA